MTDVLNIPTLILGVSLHMLLWEHLPHWGTWFSRLLGVLPRPLQTLYEQWRCPYCAGFWIGLLLHAVTGQWFIAGFVQLPEFWGPAAVPLSWFIDALAFAALNKFGVLTLTALAYPAMLGHQAKEEFMAKMSAKSTDD
ncbi:hypothetical protein [Cognatishimia maritima]|uniref:Uncharacterized protein n=1 Tax=Cognatishimia maritima TaxID=870908 RepID=A0A1M5NG85_9RHOB|nr:hypothetical protein [Cognatishimia maritima]SHG88465.1 hypothetical protein SAMN04488044_1530 [Cognatishimia maritima]